MPPPPDPSASAVTLPLTLAPPVERARPDLRLLALLALGHCVIDANQGALPAMLPFLKAALGLTYAATGVIVLTATVASSLIQPAFGYLADQTSRRWLLPASVLCCAVGFGLTGLAPSYPALLALVVVMGVGAASYHPEGYRTATAVAGARKATGVSVFSTGGNIGIALGPVVIAALVTAFGPAGSVWMVLPGLLVAGLFMAALPRLSVPAPARTVAAGAAGRGETMVGAMALLVGVIALRSWTQIGFTTFVPFYYLEVLHGDPRLVGVMLTVFYGAGAAGTLVAGPIADRVGPRRYVVSVFLLVAPFALGVPFASGPVLFVLLAVLGFVMVSTFTVSVVLGQAYLPRHPGMASGLVVGFATGAGGLGASALGWVADQWGLSVALGISAGMPVLGFLTALFLPEPKSR